METGVDTDDGAFSNLKTLLAKMERKQKQLQYLKKHQAEFVKAVSPPRIRGAGKRTKTLKLFRKMKELNTSV